MKRSNWAGLVTAVCLALLVGIAAYAAGQANASAPKVLRAERLELVDSGRVTAVLGGTPDGLGVYDPKGKLRAIVGMPADGVPALGLLDETGSCGISLDIGSDGAARLALTNRKGNAKVSLTTPSEGAPELLLRHKEGQVAIALDDSGRLVLYTGCGEACTVIWPEP